MEKEVDDKELPALKYLNLAQEAIHNWPKMFPCTEVGVSCMENMMNHLNEARLCIENAQVAVWSAVDEYNCAIRYLNKSKGNKNGK